MMEEDVAGVDVVKVETTLYWPRESSQAEDPDLVPYLVVPELGLRLRLATTNAPWQQLVGERTLEPGLESELFGGVPTRAHYNSSTVWDCDGKGTL